MKTSKAIRAWAIVENGQIGISHLTPEVSAYQIFDTDTLEHPYKCFNMIEVEIRPLKKGKK